ncbi:DEAD/DEAH box helicase-like protein [Salinisphaera sp. T5B8]|uniref:DEAD/DEAH box helicase n=1 Tax=Salinisphaera sp. T5B8 TaxID=1304154 RepID=UPI003341E54B
MIWRDGVLPEDAPPFAGTLSYDLASYGDSLLSLAMRLCKEKGNEALARSAFEHAGEAIEAVVSRGNPASPQRGFLKLLAASAFHLGHLSARAFSMLSASVQSANLSRIEQALALLILRSLDEIESEITAWRIEGVAADSRLAEQLDSELENLGDAEDDAESSEPVMDALDTALTDVFYSGLGTFIVALQTGEQDLVERARAELAVGLEQCGALNLVPQWWCFRLAIHLIEDLWRSSFHSVLPSDPPEGDEANWQSLRGLFIASLLKRRRAEIDLWPSQVDAARRAVDVSDDLVVSLPTSAGKTRVAELCILRCLSEGKRVVFITPLRALSAQTEMSLQRTFGPLGKSISSLYGSIGTSNFEGDVLKARDIVVATPEKLDFALRNDPTIIDDVGLVVLDEGHMIGLGEREVRYEVQIQRLLRRPDAHQRRIVCLSAILPDGDQFDDFVSWVRRDKEGGAVTSDWRPTRIRFGEVLWRGNHARLDLRIGDESPWVPNFFGQRAPTSGRRTALFPRDQRELVLATAWRLVEDGQSVLIYCPIRRSVEPFAKAIVDLVSRGILDSVLEVDQHKLASVLAIGREWLGETHPILACLQIGVAVHHGALPTPFRKEMERLLRDGVLKITVSSPTLAQGLNLSATAVVIHSLHRVRKIIPASEFKNVIGRAGRAFVDVEGLVLLPIFSNHEYRRNQWHELIDAARGHEMESGLVRLVLTFLVRLNVALGNPGIVELQEYVLNNATWDFPEIGTENADERQQAEGDWRKYLAVLDTAILGLLGDQALTADEIAAGLDDVLASSLWQRRIAHRNQPIQDLLRSALISRASTIWANSTVSQRRGYFLAGVGLTTGQQLDAASVTANQLLIQANGAILGGDVEQAIASIVALAEIIFVIAPFIPAPFPGNWRDILAVWLRGAPIAGAGIEVDSDVLRFIENGLIYKLSWGMEAVRVRALANADNVGGELGEMTIEDFEVGLAVPAVETGTLDRRAAILMQAGFGSRLAAIKAVSDTGAAFANPFEFNAWLNSDEVTAQSESPDWPTPDSHVLWNEFKESYAPPEEQIWSIRTGQFSVSWYDGIARPAPGTILALQFLDDGSPVVMSAGFHLLGRLDVTTETAPSGLFHTVVAPDGAHLNYTYYGPDDIESRPGETTVSRPL